MEELSKKQKSQLKRDNKIKELEAIFRRSYEMSRAWNHPKYKAVNYAQKTIEKFIIEELNRVPQDRALFLSCVSEFKENIQNILIQEENFS